MSVADRMAILESGRIRQIGMPAEIYDRTASTYARMLGSPSMTILKRATGEAEGAIRMQADSTSANAAEISVRPEDLNVGPWMDRDSQRATVFEVESLGGSKVVTGDAGPSHLRALMRGQPEIRPEACVSLSCNLDKLHFFSADGRVLAQ